ncbi:hypothetical protein JTE90_015131 [Oedothorax gibbosus]|uniref:Uncharacterized protein n=1 Tax=Oedothorax gibbosus TaxID=931172 RepID=A0AAV6VS57_9ARAC|nr:hypothetical protein JTE90_015131 [Oedothorax gibbosus]
MNKKNDSSYSRSPLIDQPSLEIHYQSATPTFPSPEPECPPASLMSISGLSPMDFKDCKMTQSKSISSLPHDFLAGFHFFFLLQDFQCFPKPHP